MRKKIKRKLLVVAGLCVLAGAAFCGWMYCPKLLGKDPTVSVVMSTYNRGTMIGPSIESVLAQTYTDFEFIIIDDGSTDKTDEILAGYAKRDPRVVVLTNNENKGLVYSLNRGIDIARGKYIMRMDDDDYSVPFRMERQVAAMEAYPEVVVMGGNLIDLSKSISELEKEEGKPKIHDTNEIEMNSYFGPGVAHPTVMLRKDFLNKHKLRYRECYLYAEDVGLWKDVLNKDGKISTMEEGVMFYRALRLLPTPRKEGYWEIQQKSWRKVQKEKISQFFPIKTKELFDLDKPMGRCKALKKMREINKTKNIVDQEGLETYYKNNCMENLDDAFLVKHPYWESLVEIKGDRFERSSKEGGTVVSREGDLIKVKWDHWGAEYFKKTKDGYEYVKDEDGTVKKKK